MAELIISQPAYNGGNYPTTVGFLQLAGGVALDSTLRAIADQAGTSSLLQLSTTGVYVPSAALSIGNGNSTGTYTIYGANTGANNYKLTLPLITGNDSLAALGVSQTFGGTQTFTNTIVGSINGNAATVTNGAYLGVAQTFTAAQTLTISNSSSVTDLTINPTTKTSGNLLDLQVGSTSRFKITNNGYLTLNTPASPSGNIFDIQINGSSKLTVQSNGLVGGGTFNPSIIASARFTDSATGSTNWVLITDTTAKASFKSLWNHNALPTSRPSTIGDIYVDTAANILANGDKVLGIRV